MSLALRNLTKSFKANRVITGVSLEAQSGETVAIFGPSGTGKTVLLRMIAGVEEPDSGQVMIDGADATQTNPDTRGIGMAFQNFALFPHMSAYDNVASGLTARKPGKEIIRAKVDQVAKLLKIDHVMGHRPRELSNGQKQRTALARALVAEPKILLLDDPLRNVDAKLRYEMRLELPSLLKKFNSTVLYVTQDYKEAMALADRIAVLIGGSFAQIAAPAEIYERPATIDVARLFGDPAVNLFEVTPAIGAEGSAVVISNMLMPIGPGFEHAAGRACTLGVRPEFTAVSVMHTPNSVPVDIVAETPLNEKTVILMRSAEGAELLASLPAEAAGTLQHGRAFLSFNPDAALLFDRASRQRIDRAPAYGVGA
jgi:multiple sugar transport system ATP-binding protein